MNKMPICIIGGGVRFYKINEPEKRFRNYDVKVKLIGGKGKLLLKHRIIGNYDLYVNVEDYNLSNSRERTSMEEHYKERREHDDTMYDAGLAMNLASNDYVMYVGGSGLLTSGRNIENAAYSKTSLKDKPSLKWLLKQASIIYGSKVFWYLERIKKINLRKAEFDSDERKANIKLALMEYEAALNTYVPMLIFKHLFDALEIAANYDGENREGKNFDGYIESLIKIKSGTIKTWREFYARTKHPILKIRKYEHIRTLTTGITELYNIIPELNKATKNLLYLRLYELYEGH